MNATFRALLLLCLLMLTACESGAPHDESRTDAELADRVEAISLLGRELRAPELPEPTRAEREQKLAEAKADYEAEPQSADALIWLGRRTAYLGRYRDAIEIFTRGIAEHPGDPRMLRHRGHRRITIRDFRGAVEDLERAAEMVRGLEERIEPDGLPNARNTPTSSLQSNIWYHLGLAHYLQGELSEARDAYRECVKLSKNPDTLVAASHWLYVTLRRSGLEEEAQEILEPIRADMDIIENHSYHRLLLLARGELEPGTLLERGADGLQNATLGYGVGSWYAYNGRRDEAETIWGKVLEGSQWAAFGYIAAESDLSRGEFKR